MLYNVFTKQDFSNWFIMEKAIKINNSKVRKAFITPSFRLLTQFEGLYYTLIHSLEIGVVYQIKFIDWIQYRLKGDWLLWGMWYKMIRCNDRPGMESQHEQSLPDPLDGWVSRVLCSCVKPADWLIEWRLQNKLYQLSLFGFHPLYIPMKFLQPIFATFTDVEVRENLREK